MVWDPSTQRVFLYGNYHRDCVSAIHCHCVGAEDGWTVTNGIGIYSAPSPKGPWRFEAGPVLAPFNQPRILGPVQGGGSAATSSGLGEWRLYMQFPLRLETSASAAGPFVLGISQEQQHLARRLYNTTA